MKKRRHDLKVRRKVKKQIREHRKGTDVEREGNFMVTDTTKQECGTGKGCKMEAQQEWQSGRPRKVELSAALNPIINPHNVLLQAPTCPSQIPKEDY